MEELLFCKSPLHFIATEVTIMLRILCSVSSLILVCCIERNKVVFFKCSLAELPNANFSNKKGDKGFDCGLGLLFYENLLNSTKKTVGK